MSKLLNDAINLFYDEAKKFYEKRRASQEASKNATSGEPKVASKSPTESPELSEMITSKEVALKQEISQTEWTNSEPKVEHLLKMLKIYTGNYYLADEQCAMWGMNPPAFLVNARIDAETSAAKTIRSLEEELSKIYGKKVVVPEV